jgi:hypothetical protein
LYPWFSIIEADIINSVAFLLGCVPHLKKVLLRMAGDLRWSPGGDKVPAYLLPVATAVFL